VFQAKSVKWNLTKKAPEEQPTSKKYGRPRKGSSREDLSKAKKRELPMESDPGQKYYDLICCW